MLPDRRSMKSCVRKVAVSAAALLLGVWPAVAPLQAQTAPPLLPQCVPPPNPMAADHWPVAATDLLGTTIGPRTFSGAALLANDTGPTALTIMLVGPATAKGGTISGSDPYVYTPAPTYSGDDFFPYVITDLAGETTMGIVHVTPALDTVFPSITLASPGVTVSGNVPLSAAASDNVGVVGVTFLDGATIIGAEV